MKLWKAANIVGLGLFLIIISLAVMAQDDGDGPIAVTHAWARPGDEMSAVYLNITNTGVEPDQLISVETSAGTAEIHTTRMENDVMRMRPVETLTIPAGETVALKPAGTHIMLLNLTLPLVENETLSLVLVFASGITLEVEARISETPIALAIENDPLASVTVDAVSHGMYLGQVVNPPIQVQDFIAPGSNSELNRLSDTNGSWRLIFFGYMHCPDFCPLTLVDYTRVKALLGDNADEVTFMLISVDSVRDTPDAMRRYLDNFDTDFVGFSPDDDTLRQIQPDYGFYYERRLDSGTQAVYTVDHSTRSYLVDRNGILRASFAYDTEPQRIADALLWYLEHE